MMVVIRIFVLAILALCSLDRANAQDVCWYDDFGTHGQCYFFTMDECQFEIANTGEGYCKRKPQTDIVVFGHRIWVDVPNYNIDETWERDQRNLAEQRAVLEIVMNQMLEGNFNDAEAEMRARNDLEGVAFVKRYAASPSPGSLRRQMVLLSIPIWTES